MRLQLLLALALALCSAVPGSAQDNMPNTAGTPTVVLSTSGSASWLQLHLAPNIMNTADSEITTTIDAVDLVNGELVVTLHTDHWYMESTQTTYRKDVYAAAGGQIVYLKSIFGKFIPESPARVEWPSQ